MNIPEYLAFPHHYKVEHIFNSTGAEATEPFFYPGAKQAGGSEGILIKVQPDVLPAWTGVFAIGRGGQTGLFSLPDQNKVCVLVYGNLFFVSAAEPLPEELFQEGITQAFQLPKYELFIVVASQGITAYGKEGVIWRRPDILGAFFNDVNGRTMDGTFEDCGRDIPFSLLIETGRRVK